MEISHGEVTCRVHMVVGRIVWKGKKLNSKLRIYISYGADGREARQGKTVSVQSGKLNIVGDRF
jgi:hypothetical protein